MSVNILVLSLRIELRTSIIIASERFVDRVSLRTRSLSEIMALGRKTSRRQRPERSQHEGSQGASSGENQTSVFITRDEMETMMKRQEELIQNLFQQIGQLGAQNREADGVQNGAGPSGVAPGLGGTPMENVDPISERERGASAQPGSSRGVNAQSRG